MELNFSLDLRCTITRDKFIWNVPFTEDFEIVRRDYNFLWTWQDMILAPLAPSNNPIYTDPAGCPIETPLTFYDWAVIYDENGDTVLSYDPTPSSDQAS